MINWKNCGLSLSCALFLIIKLVTKQMMKNQQFANAESLDKNMLQGLTQAESIEKLSSEVGDEGCRDHQRTEKSLLPPLHKCRAAHQEEGPPVASTLSPWDYRIKEVWCVRSCVRV